MLNNYYYYLKQNPCALLGDVVKSELDYNIHADNEDLSNNGNGVQQQQQQDDGVGSGGGGDGSRPPFILSYSFNQINTHLTCATQRGYVCFQLSPHFEQKTSKTFLFSPDNGGSSPSSRYDQNQEEQLANDHVKIDTSMSFSSSLSNNNSNEYNSTHQQDFNDNMSDANNGDDDDNNNIENEDLEKSILISGGKIETSQSNSNTSKQPAIKKGHSHLFCGLGIVEILFRSNIFAIVGGGPRPAFPENKVIIFDNDQKQDLGGIPCATAVKSVKLHKNMLAVVLVDKVLVYSHELKMIEKPFETYENPKGICALSPDSDNIVLAFPSVQIGNVCVYFFSLKKKKIINAHESNLAYIAISRDGTKIATASEKGTLIRVFDSESSKMIKELRRGSSCAEIYSIAFSNDNNFVCCASSTGTVHVFSICNSQDSERSAAQNRTSSLSIVNYVYNFKYTSSEWSCAEYKGIETPMICVFGLDSKTVRVVTAKGVYYELIFDLDKGEVTKLHSKDLLSHILSPKQLQPPPL